MIMGGNINLGTGGVFQWGVGVNPNDPNAAVATAGKTTFSDQLSSLGSLGYVLEYVFNANNPHLPNPQDYGATSFDQQEILNNFLNGDTQTSPFSPRSEQQKNFDTEFQNRLLSLVKDENFLKENGNLTPEQAENKIKLALLFPNIQGDSKILLALKSLQEGSPSGWPSSAELESLKEDLGTVKDRVFENTLRDLVSDPKDLTALKNAYYNGVTTGLTKEQAVIFAKILQTAGAELSTKWGIPSDADIPPAGSEYFNATLNAEFLDEFKGELFTKLYDGTITEKEFNVFNAIRNFPDPNDPDQAALKGKYEALFGQVLQNFQQGSGLPSQWSPSLTQELAQSYTDGVWRDAFAANLAKAGLPVDQQLAVLKALENPQSASPIIKTLLETLVKQTTAEVMENLNLPASWKPNNKVANPVVDPPTLAIMKNGTSLLKDLKKLGEEVLKNMPPDDPNRALLLDYLKRVGENLNKLQEMLYNVEVSLSKASKMLNAAVLDMQKNKIEEARKQAEEAKKARGGKGAKQQSDSKKTFMKIFMPIMSVMMVVMAVMTGNPLLMGLALFMLSNSLSQAAGGPDLMQECFNVLNTVLEKIFPDSKFGMFMRSMVKALMVIAITALCLIGGGMTGMMIGLTFFMEGLSKSGMMSDFVKGVCGGSDKDVMWATMAVMIAVMVVTIVITIAVSIFSGVIAAIMPPMGVGMIASQVANIASQITSLIARLMQMLSNVGQMVARIVQAVQRVVQVVTNILKKIVEFVRTAVNQVKEWTKTAIDTVKFYLSNAKTWAQNTVDALKETITKVAKNAMEEAPKILKEFTKKVQEYAKRLEDLFKKIKDTLKLDKIFKGFKEMSVKEKTEFVGNLAISGSSVGTGIQNMIEGINQAKLAFLMAEIAKKIAASQAYIEEVGALIKLLKQVIQDLIESMGPVAEFIKEINALQTKKFQDASSGQGWLALQSGS